MSIGIKTELHLTKVKFFSENASRQKGARYLSASNRGKDAGWPSSLEKDLTVFVFKYIYMCVYIHTHI